MGLEKKLDTDAPQAKINRRLKIKNILCATIPISSHSRHLLGQYLSLGVNAILLCHILTMNNRSNGLLVQNWWQFGRIYPQLQKSTECCQMYQKIVQLVMISLTEDGQVHPSAGSLLRVLSTPKEVLSPLPPERVLFCR